MTRKHVLDMFMTLLFLLVMDVGYTKITLHEMGGLMLFFLFCLHHRWNMNWHRTVSYSVKTPSRLLSVAVNTVLALALTGVMISGFLISRRFLPLPFTAPHIWHAFHIWCAYVMVVFIGLHIGLHGDSFFPRIRHQLRQIHPTALKTSEKVARLCFTVGGIWASFLYHIGDRLLMRPVHLADRSLASPMIFIPAHLLILALWAVLARYLSRWQKRF